MIDEWLPMIDCLDNMLQYGQRICRRFTTTSNINRMSRFQSTKMNASQLFKEERLPWYSHDQFYPARMGEVLDSSFKIIGKLGYGAYSTVWLCQDIRFMQHSSPSVVKVCSSMHRERDTSFVSSYVTVKICTRDAEKSAQFNRELDFYEHVSSMESHHHGQAYVRGPYGEFELDGPTGKHLCLAHPPMHMTIQQLQYHNLAHKLDIPLLKCTLANVLKALSFLYDEAKIVHKGTAK